MKRLLIATTVVAILSTFFSCKKDSFIKSPNALLNISADSIKFDTVFTSTGSVTQSFKIFNDNSQKLLLSKVKLMGGPSSAFKINIDGVAATEVNDIEIAANDSIYVFVSVTVDPTTANLPFIISDSILINYNGNDRFVQLQAYGQNAHFFRNQSITTNTSWTNDLPYVILGGLTIDAAANLTIEEGTKVYLHADAPILVDGTLTINGTKTNNVVFTGDRLDPYYKDLPASWPGIYFRTTSKDNEMTFAVIKNSFQAVVIQDPPVNANAKLIMHQCIIDNAFNAGIFCINSKVRADNCLISNCSNNIAVQLGGDYIFTHCTVVSYSNAFMLHQTPVLGASNAAIQNGTTITSNLDALFQNCIFWGNYGTIDDEVVIDKEGNNSFNVTLDHCLYKALNDPSNTTLTEVIRNEDPLFDSVDISNKYYDFRTTKNAFAPGIDKGIITGFPKDLDDNPRNIVLPDLGSYEKQ